MIDQYTETIERWIQEGRRNGNTTSLIRSCLSSNGVILAIDEIHANDIRRKASEMKKASACTGKCSVYTLSVGPPDGMAIDMPVFVDNYTIMRVIRLHKEAMQAKDEEIRDLRSYVYEWKQDSRLWASIANDKQRILEEILGWSLWKFALHKITEFFKK